jgi:hypothetical protein
LRGFLEKKRRYGNKVREDKNALKLAKCPFCHELFERPETIRAEFSTFLGGRCSCGAVYACDETGKNLGEIHMDALVFAADGDWDKALSLVPGEDYDEVAMDYKSKSHSVPAARKNERFSSTEKILFIKLRK